MKITEYCPMGSHMIVRVVKIIIFLMVCGLLQVHAAARSQTITLSVKNEPLKKVLQQVKAQTGYIVFGPKAVIEQLGPVSIQAEQMPIAHFFELLLKDQPIAFEIGDESVLLTGKTSGILDRHPVGVDKDRADGSSEQQPKTVTGTVTDSLGNLLQGVTIRVKGSNQATVTDRSGRFLLNNVSQRTTLTFTLLGYQPKEITIANEYTFTITLNIAASLIDETVIIGYGTTTKRLNTGSVGRISAETISQQPVTNVMSALSGRIPGVFVQTTNGLPGGEVKIQIRGRQSIAAGTDPLYIVDGVPFSSSTLTIGTSNLNFMNGPVSPLNVLSPDDIASIEVLKDADATAIYGSRGANGVILITTKKGSSNSPDVSVKVIQGFSQVSRKANFLSLKEYLMLRKEAFQNEGIEPSSDPTSIAYAPDLMVWDTTKSTNWQDYALGGNAPFTTVQTGFSGGSELTQFLLDLNYHNEGTVLKGDQNYKRFGGNLNFNHASLNKKFSIQALVNYTKDDNKTLKDLGALSVASLPPNFPIYLPDGTLNWELGKNPIAYVHQRATNKTENLITNMVLSYRILSGFSFKTNVGFTSTAMDSWSATPASSQNPTNGATINSAYFGNQSTSTILAEPQLLYSKTTKAGEIAALMGLSWQRSYRKYENLDATDYADDHFLENISSAGRISDFNDASTLYKYVSLFGRLTYGYRKKYLFNINLRRDGSSRFGPGNQFGNFGAVGAAWIFSEENIIRNHAPYLSFGKLRGSYGIVGNDQIPDYQYLATYTKVYTYLGLSTLNPSKISNADYRWESTRKIEGALELGFFNSRLNASFAYFNHQSDNQLVAYPIPFMSGSFGSYQANLPALVRNTGWEIELSVTPLKTQALTWSSSFNITLPKNELVKYPGLAVSSYANQYTVGEDLSNIKGYRFLGIDAVNGIATFEDVNNDGFITSSGDYVARGKTSPDFYGGLGNQLQYKGFSLDIFLQFVKQHSRTNIYLYQPPGPLDANKYSSALDRWQQTGDLTTIQRAFLPSNSGIATAFSNLSSSNASLKNASYIRLKNISLRYAIPARITKQLHLNSMEVFGLAQNLLTWTPLSATDPEVADISMGAPVLRSFTMGITIRF